MSLSPSEWSNRQKYMMIRCGQCGTRFSSTNYGCPICSKHQVRSPVIEDKGEWL